MSKEFQLLLELLLIRESGAYETVDEAIGLALDLYCEKEEIDRQVFIQDLKEVYHLVWDRYFSYPNSEYKNWKTYQTQYKLCLKSLRYKKFDEKT